MPNSGMSVPTYAEITGLPRFVPVRTIPPEFEDVNKHVNIRNYLDLGSEALIAAFVSTGVDDAYRDDRGMGIFTASNHLNYFAELHAGEEVSAYASFLDRSDKAVHAIAYVLDETHRRLAATFESLTIHVDMSTRRPVAFPADLARGLDALIARTAAPWPAPVCGAIAIRR